MKYAVLEKKKFDDFCQVLAVQEKLVAPVSKGNDQYSYEEVKDVSRISLEHIPTILPPKKYFMPQYETLIEYDTNKKPDMEAIVEVEYITLMGVHTCDLAGIQCLNIVFSDRPRDLNYLVRKKYITIIGIECDDYCDEYASCGLMNNFTPNGGYDLFMTDLGEYYILHVNTQVGEDLITKYKNFFTEAEAQHINSLEAYRQNKKNRFKPEIPVNRTTLAQLFQKGFDSEVWDEIGGRCLSCGNCTNVCPTCYCFDMQDVPNLDLKTGKRIRVWDSCQNEPFAKVAGGESFRENRKDRKRHRFNRKFNYPIKRWNRFFCTGCGRCSRTCMAEINLKETIVALAKDVNMLEKA